MSAEISVRPSDIPPPSSPMSSPHEEASSTAPAIDPVIDMSPNTRHRAARRPIVEVSRLGKSGGGGPPETVEPEFLQPAEFYPLNNHTGKITLPPPRPDGLLSPEDDKLAMRGIPIFRPTLAEFEDFEAYVTKTVPWGQYSGIVKIIPPTEWTKSLPSIPAQALADVEIRSPIQQNMLGQAGLFRATNVEKNKNRPLSVKEWFEKSNNGKFRGPGPNDVDMTLDRDSTAVKTRRAEEARERKSQKDALREKRKAALLRKKERDAKKAAELANGGELQAEGEAEGIKGEEEDEDLKEEEEITEPANSQLIDPPVPPLDPSTYHSPQSSTEESAKTPESASHHEMPDVEVAADVSDDSISKPKREVWYDEFDPNQAWLPKNTAPEDYTPEACANLERKFWKTMGLGEPSWYGADLQGTLFPDPKTPWNVAHLPNLLNRLGRDLPGVNRPYLYFGMWRAAFAWHVEDMDLFSINYIHFGAPKFWYAIPQGQAEQFERTITSYFPREASQCDQFLRHKAYVMSPTRLAKDGIHVNMLVHKQGEFVITYPRGYHAGWNMGFNCAESVNFALDSWVELGRRAKVCKCVSHSVRIDMDELLGENSAMKEQKEKMRTEQELIDAIAAERARGPKRPRPSQADRPRKRAKVESNGDEAHLDLGIIGDMDIVDGPTLPIAGMEKKRKAISLEKKALRVPAITQKAIAYPCVLCVNTSTEGLLDVFEPNDLVRSMCKSVDGVPRAHEVCANSLPETWISEIAGVENSKPVVAGVSDINKARWKLKCQSCTDKKLAGMGAKIQCTSGKCPRAFHVTCARDDECVVYRVWEIEEPVEPTEDSETSEPTIEKVTKIECLCPTHNPNVKEAKKMKAAQELKAKIHAILPGETAKIKSSRGLFEVKMLRVIDGEQVAEVEYADGQPGMVKWSDFDFRPAAAPKMVENEYAREYNTTRNEEGKIVQLTPMASSSTPVKSGPAHRRQPLSVNQMLNHPTPSVEQVKPIPSRVVVCDSDYRPPIPTQYAEPPPSFLTHGPPQLAYSSGSYHQSYSQYPPPAYGPIYGHSNGRMNGYEPPPMMYGYPASGHAIYGAVPHQLHASPSYPPSHHPQYPQYSHPPAHHLPPMSMVPNYSMNYHPSNGHPISQNHSSRSHASHSSTPSRGQPRSLQNSQASSSQPQHKAQPPLRSVNGVGKIDLGLERMQTLMRLLPPLQIPAIHLAGTNGKGSVSAFLETMLRRAGLRVARYNSPHLVEPRDAISLDGVPPSHRDYTAALQRVTQLSSQHNINATTFEIATAAAYDLIMEYQPDVMVIECGMGGVGDATNVIPPEYVLATALTSVGLDHTAFLGETIEEITTVKAGIAVPGGLAVIAPQMYNGVARIARQIASDKGSRVLLTDRATDLEAARPTLDLRTAERLPSRRVRIPRVEHAPIDVEMGLAGDHQLDNVSVAVNIVTALRSDQRALSIVPKLAHLTDQAIATGVAITVWKGRCSFHRLASSSGTIPILVDGAHNADSATTLKRFLIDLKLQPTKKITWIISLSDSKGKTPESVLRPLLSKGDRVFVTGFSAVEGMPWVRPVSSDILADTVNGLTGGEAVVRSGVGEAIKEIGGWKEEDRGLVVIAGSLYGVADFYRLLGQGS